MKHCLDCGKLLSNNPKAKRCKPCSLKGKLNPAFKNGLFIKDNYCIKCGSKISRGGNKQCVKCYILESKTKRLGKNNPFYGKTHSEQYKKVLKEKMSGSKNHNWKDGRSYIKYPSEFSEPLKQQIRNRDNNKCVICGMTELEHFQKYNRNLEVHHKDHNRKNCVKNNLETRCKKCNIADN